MTGVVDLRTYRLKPGAGTEFGRVLKEDALPLLARAGIDVVGYGRSLDDPDLYFLMRAFPSAAERDGRLAAFYGSEEWQPHQDRVLGLIEDYHVLLIHDSLAH